MQVLVPLPILETASVNTPSIPEKHLFGCHMTSIFFLILKAGSLEFGFCNRDRQFSNYLRRVVVIPGPTGGKAPHLNNVYTLTMLCFHAEKPHLGVQQNLPNSNIESVRISQVASDTSRSSRTNANSQSLLFLHINSLRLTQTQTGGLSTSLDQNRTWIAWYRDAYISMLTLCAATIGSSNLRTICANVIDSSEERQWFLQWRVQDFYTRAPIDFQRRSGGSLGFKSTVSEQRTFNLKLMKFKIKTSILLSICTVIIRMCIAQEQCSILFLY